MKIYLFTILTFFCSFTLFAKEKLAIIKDPDGFTLVRNGQGKGFKVVDTLFKEDFFYFQSTGNSEWAKVTAWNGRQVEGFVHKSRILEFEKLDSRRQKEIILKTLDRQRLLAVNSHQARISKDSLALTIIGNELRCHTDARYDPILGILPSYFCSTSDMEVLQIFFATIWADKGSANEMPSFALGDCFICKPDLVMEQLSKIKDNEQKKLLFEDIEWGLLNHYHVDENVKSTNAEFNKLKARLEKERKKVGQ